MTTLQKVIKYCALAFAIFLIVSIIGGAVAVITSLTHIFSNDEEIQMAGENKTYSVSQDISQLEIKLGAIDLKIVTGDRLSLESNLKDLSVKESGGRLKITTPRKLSGANYNGVTMTLTVPVNTVFASVNISTGAGRLEIQDLQTEVLNMELGAGEVTVHCLTVTKKTDIDGGAGKVTIADGALHDLDLDMGLGEMNLCSRLSGNCDIDHGMGEANLDLIGTDQDYRIRVSKGLGDIRIDGKSVSDNTTHGSGETKIEIDGGIGAIHIRFVK